MNERTDNTLFKVELYILSLLLLFVFLIIATIPVCLGSNCRFISFKVLLYEHQVLIGSIIMVIVGLIIFIRFKYRISKSGNLPEEILEVEDDNYEHLTFLATYIIPLITFDLNNNRFVIILLLLLIIIGAIFVKTDKFHVNPTLSLFGFKIYKVKAKSRSKTRNYVLVSLDKIKKGDNVSVQKFDENVRFGKLI